MKLLISWNSWSNYDDILINSEMCRELNKNKIFSKLYLCAQSAYKNSPTNKQLTYLNKFFKIKTELDNVKNIDVNKTLVPARIFAGYKIAYEYALEKGCDFAIVTNADAWFLNFKKLKKLLLNNKVQEACISSRVGKLTYLFSNFGTYAPFFDDHFLIININECKKYNIFKSIDLNLENSIYNGGFDYQFLKFLDFYVPKNKHYIYSDMSKSTNHFGGKNNCSLLPFIYENQFGFLHANVAVDNYLHYLRAKIIELNNLNNTKFTKIYCDQYSSKSNYYHEFDGSVYFKPLLSYKIKIFFYIILRQFYYSFLRIFKYNKLNYKYKKYINNSHEPYNNYRTHIKIPSSIFSKIRYHNEFK